MSNIKRYKLDFDWKADIVIEIDHDKANEAFFHQLNEFWMDSEDRVDEDGSAFSGVMKLLGAVILQLTVEFPNKNTNGIKQLFIDGQEGWPTMDGEYGIKIVSVDSFCFDSSDFRLEELTA